MNDRLGTREVEQYCALDEPAVQLVRRAMASLDARGVRLAPHTGCQVSDVHTLGNLQHIVELDAERCRGLRGRVLGPG